MTTTPDVRIPALLIKMSSRPTVACTAPARRRTSSSDERSAARKLAVPPADPKPLSINPETAFLPVAACSGAEDMIGYLDMIIAEVFGGLRPIADFRRIVANRAGREKSAEFHWVLVSVGRVIAADAAE